MDPITISVAVGAAQAAVKGIRQMADFYKEAKAAGKDVMDIVDDVTGALGKFWNAQDDIRDAEKKIKEVKTANNISGKKKQSLDAAALDAVIAKRKMAEYETELRNLLIYTFSFPYDDFLRERDRLRKEREAEERWDAKKKPMQLSADKRSLCVGLGCSPYFLSSCSWARCLRSSITTRKSASNRISSVATPLISAGPIRRLKSVGWSYSRPGCCLSIV